MLDVWCFLTPKKYFNRKRKGSKQIYVVEPKAGVMIRVRDTLSIEDEYCMCVKFC